MRKAVELLLPFPPSVNHYWLVTKQGGRRVSPRGTEFRDAVWLVVSRNVRLADRFRKDDRLRADVRIYLPDGRQRDIDNIFKALFDAVTKSNLWYDDSQVRKLCAETVERTKHEYKAGAVALTVSVLED